MSTFATVHTPGMRFGARPEKKLVKQSSTDRYLATAFAAFRGTRLNQSTFGRKLKQIRAMGERHYEDQEFNDKVSELSASFKLNGLNEKDVITGLSLAVLKTRHVMGFELHDSQLFAAWCLLHGVIAEMDTGEGKTLTAAIAAIVASFTGASVHLITANPYLAERDANSLLPLYQAFSLRSSVVTDSMNDAERRSAYGASIVHVSHKQIVFDYLRDRTAESPANGHKFPDVSFAPGRLITQKWQQLIAPHQPQALIQGLCFAIVDEADSVLIDDAITPLILARASTTAAGRESEVAVALSVARLLVEGVDFTFHRENCRVWLLENGLETTRQLGEQIDGVWRFERYRNERIRQALIALYGYRINRDYIVKNNSIVLIDASTGRPTPDRQLSNGLHRMLELKEGVDCSGDTEVLASTTFQRFFPRYISICGLTGTAHEVRGELARVYGTGTVKVARNTKCIGKRIPSRILTTDDAWLAEIVNVTASMVALGRPVLIGTRSVEQSERVADALVTNNFSPRVLNARQDASEAEIVASTGTAGKVTVATNMAGRGTDIKLCQEARRNGGLHVLHVELNDSMRIDRQLFGRAARQGDPGSWQSILSLESPRLLDALPSFVNLKLLPKMVRLQQHMPAVANFGIQLMLRRVQRQTERRQMRSRAHLSNHHQSNMRLLAVSGIEDE